MSHPLVVCVMLTRDRPAMTRRAVDCFEAQTYKNKRLYIYDTGVTPCTDALPDGFPDHHIVYHRGLQEGLSVGALRNRANWWAVRPYSDAAPDADLIAHLDSDDLSHPNRLTEQVALLESSGAECVGFSSCLFYNSVAGPSEGAWEYRNDDKRYSIGSSFLYRRECWERNPFPDRMRGEDLAFLKNLKSVGTESIVDGDPLMVCSIHSGNVANYSRLEPPNWIREPSWDIRLRELMTNA